MIPAEKLDELRQLASKATPGPWGYDDGAVICGDGWGFSSVPSQYRFDPEDTYMRDIPEGVDSDRDSQYIAAMNPTQCLELLDEIAKYREALEYIAAPTYGTEPFNTDEERAKIYWNHIARFQFAAREALK